MMTLVGGDPAIVERRSFPGELSHASILEAWSSDGLVLGWGRHAAVQQQSGALRSLVFKSQSTAHKAPTDVRQPHKRKTG